MIQLSGSASVDSEVPLLAQTHQLVPADRPGRPVEHVLHLIRSPAAVLNGVDGHRQPAAALPQPRGDLEEMLFVLLIVVPLMHWKNAPD